MPAATKPKERGSSARATVSPTPANMPPRRNAAKNPAPPAALTTRQQVNTPTGSLDIEIREVDAAQALEWMDRNVSNRTIKKNRVTEFKNDMLDGKWFGLGDPLRFDVDDNLCDGQHRLLAMIQAEEEQPGQVYTFIIIRGITADEKVAIDSGTRRSTGDQLKMAGYSNPNLVAAAARWIIVHRRGQIYSDRNLKALSHREIMEFVNDDELIHVAAARCMNKYVKRIYMPMSFVCTGYYLMFMIDPEMADDFYDRLADGVNLGRDHPILVLRNKLLDIDKQKPRMSGDMWLSLLFRAWNFYRKGKTTSTFPLYKTADGVRQPVKVPDLV